MVEVIDIAIQLSSLSNLIAMLPTYLVLAFTTLGHKYGCWLVAGCFVRPKLIINCHVCAITNVRHENNI